MTAQIYSIRNYSISRPDQVCEESILAGGIYLFVVKGAIPLSELDHKTAVVARVRQPAALTQEGDKFVCGGSRYAAPVLQGVLILLHLLVRF